MVAQEEYEEHGSITDGEISEFLSNPEEFSVEIGSDITFPCHVRHQGEYHLLC